MPVKFTFSSPIMKSWLLIHQTHRLLEKNDKAVMKEAGLTPRKHAVLLAMHSIPSPPKVNEVAAWLDRNPNGISRLIDRMEKDGLVERTRDTVDRRAARLTVTPKGEGCYKKANELFRQHCRDIFAALSEEELAVLSKIMGSIRKRTMDLLEPEHPEGQLQVLHFFEEEDDEE